MTWKTIFNPFEKFDEKHMLTLGIIFFIINIFGCSYAGLINDSIFHLSMPDDEQTIWDVSRINFLSYIFAMIVLLVFSKFINRKARIIDIINTVLVSQIPLIIAMPMMGLPFYKAALSSVARGE